MNETNEADVSARSAGQRKSMQPSLPRRPSYEKVIENIDKWANSSGLQKPK